MCMISLDHIAEAVVTSMESCRGFVYMFLKEDFQGFVVKLNNHRVSIYILVKTFGCKNNYKQLFFNLSIVFLRVCFLDFSFRTLLQTHKRLSDGKLKEI